MLVLRGAPSALVLTAVGRTKKGHSMSVASQRGLFRAVVLGRVSAQE